MPSLYQYSEIPCFAPLRTPPPFPNATLLSLFLFIRHGARAPEQIWHFPGNSGEWHCNGLGNFTKFRNVTVNNQPYTYYDFSTQKPRPEDRKLFHPTCHPGSLLDKGVQDLVELGKFYQNYAASNIDSFSSQLNLKQFYLRSSFIPRCIESALSFLNGFFDHIEEPINETIEFVTGQMNDDPLVIVPAASDLMLESSFRFAETDEYKQRIKELKEIIKKFDKYLNVSFPIHEMQALLFGDYINTLRCSKQDKTVIRDEGHTQPQEELMITPEIHKIILNDMNFFEAGFVKFDKIATLGPILQLILQRMESYYSLESHCKFSLFSGHDATLNALLTYFGTNTTYPPPFASQVLLEFWYSTRPYLRVVYNGDVITTLPVSQFKKDAEILVAEYLKVLEKSKNEKEL